MKVIITEQRGETGLLLAGTPTSVSKEKAKLWVKNKWAKYFKEPKEDKPKVKAKTKK